LQSKYKYSKICIIFLFCLIIFSAFPACKKEKQIEQPDEVILVNIDDKVTISKNEFIRRAEYTIRPPYCKANTYLHKKIILNSLIAEKLLALEAGTDNKLSRDDSFLNFIKGRKEQSMRQWMHHQEATKHAAPDSLEINKYYKYAGREYRTAYYSFSDTSKIKNAVKRLSENTDNFEQIYQQTFGDSSVPKMKVTFNEGTYKKVLKELYSGEVHKGKVLEPISVNGYYYLFIKVLGWEDTKALTGTQIHDRLKKVSETLTMIKSAEIWKEKVGRIMKGKTLDFNELVFWELNDIFFKLYFKSADKKQDMLKKKIWDIEQDISNSFNDKAGEDILQKPFLTIDGVTWTVNDFKTALMSHPLVFRNRKMPSAEFAKQFRLAAADLLRDIYITKEAYKKGYDKVSVVRRNENMWRDAYLGLYQKSEYLETLNLSDKLDIKSLSVIGGHLNSLADSLQKKYYKKVYLDFDEFEDIALSSIDVFVKQKGQPYQHIVPMFPVLTTNHNISYIAKMK